ncbi:MAG: 8-oxo-dGTP diphosphatase [Archaeoglobi archaeon]|nr:8-oxo-dGTP diphosphatase [Archaeoglobi archaeon]MDK2781207.1 8-oxo-dGTP diphosphatase [Archaeoglobi archaeon]
MVKHPIPSVGALIFRNGRLLVIKRGNPPYAGYWSVPGGKVNWGESLEEALKREIREELLVEIEVEKLAGIVESIYREDGEVKYHYIIIDYFCRIVSGEPVASDDALELRWVTMDELKELDVTPTLLKLLKNIGMI